MTIRHSPTWATLPGKPSDLAGFGLDSEVNNLVQNAIISGDLLATLQNGWLHGVAETSIRCMLTPQGLVIVQGVVHGGDSDFGVIANLPSGTFPEEDLYFTVPDISVPAQVVVKVTTGGDIVFIDGPHTGPISLCLAWYIVL